MLLVDDDAPFTIFPVMTREGKNEFNYNEMHGKSVIPKENFCCHRRESEKRLFPNYNFESFVHNAATDLFNFSMNEIYCYNFFHIFHRCRPVETQLLEKL